jgi:hypothetical protein
MMKLLSVLLVAVSAFGAIGDHAPSIPAGYVDSHPRLGAPDTTYLNAVWAQRAVSKTSGGSKYFFDTANAWTQSSGKVYWDCRYLLIAYMADALNSGPSHTTYLTLIKSWNRNGGNANTWGVGSLSGSFCTAIAYDWLYNDLDTTTRTGFLADLNAYSQDWENGLASIGPSPYNDVEYIDDTMLGLPVALAAYSRTITAEKSPASLAHLRYAMDYVLNMQVPVWQQVFGPRGTKGTLATTDGTGMWHETWEYIGAVSFGMLKHIGPVMLSWARATNNYPGLFTTDYPWLKNIMYQTMYMARPDFTLERINGSRDGGWLVPEYTATGGQPAQFGTLELLAEAYKADDDGSIVRGWAREVDWSQITPYGFEPTAFPFLTPDSASNTATSRANLQKVRNFTNWGTVFRTGWGENDTFATLRCGEHYWSHDIQDAGAFTIFSRGALAIRSGTYIAGSASMHYYLYAKQAISQNVPLVIDGTANSGNDYYASETVGVLRKDGTTSNVPMPNDGGQRRVGSGWQTGNLSAAMQAPADVNEWRRDREEFHACTNIGFAVSAGYSASFIDMTAAYNNTYSHNPHTSSSIYDQANTTNRTYRVQNAVRGLVFIPRGTAAYVIIYDQLNSANPAMTKKWLLHSIEQPTISGNHVTINHNRTVSAAPVTWFTAGHGGPHGLVNCVGACASATQYVYAGQMDMWMTVAGTAPYSGGGTNKLCPIGGSGHEFDIGATTDASCTPTYGTNYNECMINQCDSTQGVGGVVDFINPDATVGSSEPGSWRTEEEAGAAHRQDWFLNVALARNASDGNTVSTAPATADDGAGNWVTVWKDNSNTCTYTLTLPKNGVGGAVTIQGAGCSTVVN